MVGAALSADLQGLLTLHLVPGLGPRLTAALLKRFGSPDRILSASVGELQEVPHIGSKTAGDLYQAMRSADVAAELDLMARHDVHLLALGTPEYPAALAEIADPPHLLFVRGTLAAADAKAVAVVGSRHCSSYGRRAAERLAAGLVQKGYTIISGLPRGTSLLINRSGRRWMTPLAN